MTNSESTHLMEIRTFELETELERLKTENQHLRQLNGIHQKEQLFQDMFLYNNAIQLIIEPKTGKIQEANYAAVAFYGYSLDEFKKLSIHDLNLLPKDNIQNHIQEAQRRKQNCFRFRHRLANLKIRDVEVYSTPVFYADKVCLFSIIHDITEQEQTRERLRESEERYKKLSNLTFEGIVLIHENHTIFDVNASFLRMFGYKRTEVIGKSFLKFINQDYHKKVSHNLLHHRTKPYEMNAVHASGKILFMELESKNIEENGEVTQVIALRNITERKKAQLELRRIYQHQQTIMDTVPIGIGFMTKQRFIFVNNALTTIFGYRSDELINQSIKKLYAKKKTYEYIGQNAYPMIARGKTFKDECLMITKQGQVFWCEVTGRMVSKDENASIWTFENVNRRKKNEIVLHQTYSNLKVSEKAIKDKNAALTKAYDELRNTQSQLVQSEKMASLGQLTAGIAHEMNNPLNFIYAGADALSYNLEDFYKIYEAYQSITPENIVEKLAEIEILTEDYDSDFDFKNEFFSVLNDIQSGASRLSEIIQSLRIFTRRDEATLKKSDIHENLNATLLLLRRKHEECQIEIIRHFDETIPPLECFFGKLNQAFVNILNNALEAQAQQIHITTSLETIAERKYVQIIFQDNGNGIDYQSYKKIFDPFFSTKTNHKGLGLSMVYEIIQEHAGFIIVNSEEAKGTQITLQVPYGLSKIFKNANTDNTNNEPTLNLPLMPSEV